MERVLAISQAKANLLFDEDLYLIKMPRKQAENNSNFRHIISYSAILCQRKIALYQRAGSETRLHGSLSIGFGGHVTTEDIVLKHEVSSTLDGLYDIMEIAGAINIDATVRKALRRELEEEVGLQSDDFERIGLITLDKTPVDFVHVGVAFSTKVETFDMVRTSFEIKEISWVSKQELKEIAAKGKLESWSCKLLEFLEERHLI